MKPHLPQFILLRGTRHLCHEFYSELSKRTEITYMDLCDPILEETVNIFYGHTTLDVDTLWTKTLPDTAHTLESWIAMQRDFWRATLGRDILAKIFTRYYLEHDWQTLFPTIVIRDYDEKADLDVIQNRFGPNSCLIVVPPFDVDAFIQQHTPNAAA